MTKYYSTVLTFPDYYNNNTLWEVAYPIIRKIRYIRNVTFITDGEKYPHIMYDFY